MQTPTVSNPANVLTSPPTAGKQSDAGKADTPFGQVLSREIAGRSANESGRPDTSENGRTVSARQSRNEAQFAEVKSIKDAKKQARSQDADVSAAAAPGMDAAMQASEDMLALVANIVQINQAADPTASGQASENAEDHVAGMIASDTNNTATILLASSPLAAPPIAPIATQPAPPLPASDVTLVASDVATNVLMPATGVASTVTAASTAAGIMAQGQAEAVTAVNTEELPADMSDLAAKGRDLLNGTVANDATFRAPARLHVPEQVGSAPSMSGTSSAVGAQDFSSSMKDSLSALTSATNTATTPIQQAAVNAAQSMGNHAERLTPRVGTPAWDQALGQKVVWMVAGEQQSASLTLNPPDLGPLQVVLNVSNSQASATFTAAQPEVRQALEAALPKLREMLGEAGIQLGQASVNSGAPNQQGAFDQSAAGASSHGQGHADHRDAGTDTESPRVSRVRPATSGQGMVDTFA